MKKLVLGGVALLAMSFTVSAADLLPCGARGEETVSGLEAKGGCISSDKIFENFSNITPADGSLPIPADWQVNISEPFPDEHTVDFVQCNLCSALSDPAIGTPTKWGIQYTIRVDTANFPQKVITSIGVSENGTPGSKGTVQIQKFAYDKLGNLLAGTFPLTTSGTEVSTSIPPSQWILIKEYITVDKGTVTAFSDRFVQSSVPEPATYGMMGLGLAVLGLVARRKKA